MSLLVEEATRSHPGAPARGVVGTALSFVVTVVSGPDRGLSFELGGEKAGLALVGVSRACPLKLTDPLVSRQHAALEITPGGLRVQDLGSKNGTTVNGLRVASALLTGGEVVRLGATVLKIERPAEASTPRRAAEESLRESMDEILESDLPFTEARSAALGEFERVYVARVLARHGGHVGRAAAAAGIARRYFQLIRGRCGGR